MIKFTAIALTVVIAIASCQTTEKASEETVDGSGIYGSWLVVYPKHFLKNDDHRVVYAMAQDSIVNLFGLKLVEFSADGSFKQADSSHHKPGSWQLKENGLILIDKGGLGFDGFRGDLIDSGTDTLKIAQDLKLEDQTVRVVWYLRKLNDADSKTLLGEKENWWRQKPSAEESDTAVKARLKDMLEYYSAYFTLVSRESSYFAQHRVMIPFSYYQHQMGLKAFRSVSPFANVFYNESNARKAYGMIETAMKKLSNEAFPSDKDFVIEYAKYIKRLSEEI
jgi:hypothetical protein